MAKVLGAVIPPLWMGAIAIIAVQNATPVSIQFLWGRSVPLPFGVVLAFGAAIAWGVTAALLALLPPSRSRSGGDQRPSV